MSDGFTEVTHESWFSRIGGALKGVLIGIVLVLVSFPVLFINEGRAVKRGKTLKQGQGEVVSVDSAKVNSNYDGKLIHTTGKASTEEKLEDSVFDVSAQAIRLQRKVEMYQWQEDKESKKEKKLGGGTKTVTHYSYQKVWSSKLINSQSFNSKGRDQHQNPNSMPYTSQSWDAGKVQLGAYQLTPSLIKKLDNFKPLTLNGELPPALKDKAQQHQNTYYFGQNPGSPAIGDVRVSFQVIQPLDVSVVARQTSTTFEPHTTKNGGTIEMIKAGTFSAQNMFEQAHQENRMLTWGLRALGFILMAIGFMAFFKPLSVLADVVPFIGSIVGAGTGFIAFLLAAMLSCMTISVAWIFYRPLIAIPLLVVAVVLGFVMVKKMRRAKSPA